MSEGSSLLPFIRDLAISTDRPQAVRALANRLGVDLVVIFIFDAEIEAWLAAPGFPQTLPQGLRWQNFVSHCERDGSRRGYLPWPSAQDEVPALAIKPWASGAVVFLGPIPAAADLEAMNEYAPLLAAGFLGERAMAGAALESEQASRIAQEARTLALCLDEARRAAQLDVAARREAEVRLARAKLELEHHNQTLEKAVAQRTQKLSETVAELEAFSYSIAHDMRAPLRAMQGFAEILLKEHAPHLDSDGQGLLGRIARAADRMDQLIRDVLSYSRIVRDEAPLDRIELEPLISGILETYPGFGPDQADISVIGAFPAVRGNAAMLSQVLSNLIGNAVKFVKAGQKPKVIVSSQMEGEWVRISVQDFGIGVPPDQYEKIFGIFQRVELNYPGTGIGLAVVKKGMERMRGKVGLVSEMGVGTTFWLLLPHG